MPLSYIGPQALEAQILADELWRRAGYGDGSAGRSRFLRLVTELPPQKLELFQVYALLVMEEQITLSMRWANILIWGFFSEHQGTVKLGHPDVVPRFQDCWPEY